MLKLPPGLAGRYADAVHLGSGAMGDVFRVVDRELGRTVAIKTFATGGPDGTDRRRRLEREARYLAGVRHPNVVSVLDFHSEGGVALMVMEFVEGSSLGDAIAGAILTTPDAVRIMADLADGLAAVHAAGVLHRDLKPGNVLLTREGVPKLADFGLGKLLESGAETELTREGYVVGTLGYIAPEVLLGASATPASEVYGLGVVLYETLTGVHPVGRDQFHRMVTGQTLSPFVPPSRHRPSVNEALDSLVERAMHPDPARRPASAAVLRDGLRAWLTDAGFGDPSASVTEDPSGATGRFSAPRQAPGRIEAPKRKRQPAPLLVLVAATVVCLLLLWPRTTALTITDLAIEAAVVEARATFTTATARRLSIRILDPATGSPVFRIDEPDAALRHTVAATGLRPGSEYLLEIRDGNRSSIHSLRTTVPALAKPPRVLRIEGALHATAVVEPPGPLTLEILDDAEGVIASETDASTTGRILVSIPEPAQVGRGPVPWRLRCGTTLLDEGGSADCRPALPVVDGQPAPVMGSLSLLGDDVVALTKDGRLLVLRPGTGPGGVHVAANVVVLPPEAGKVIHRERPPIVRDGDTLRGILLADPPRAHPAWWLWKASPGLPPTVSALRLEVHAPLEPVEAVPDGTGGLIVLWARESLAVTRVDPATGSTTWLTDLPLPQFVKQHALADRLMIRDMGSSPVSRNGLGFLAPPLSRPEGVFLLVGAAADPQGRSVQASPLVLPRNLDGSPGSPVALGQVPVAAARQELLADAAGSVRFAALDRMARLAGSPPRCRLGPPPGDSPLRGHLGGPVVEAGGRRFALAFSAASNAREDLRVTSQFALVSFDDDDSPRRLSPPLCHEPAGDLQASAALRAFVVEDRLLVVVTRLTAAVMDLTTGAFGSVALEKVASDAALAPNGDLLIVFRHEGSVLALPLPLIQSSRAGRLTEAPLGPGR